MQTCPSCGEKNSERARFCQACATPLPESVEPTADVRKVVTIVFADMAGSTQIGEKLDPEALRRVQARYFDAMAAVLGRHGGTVEKYIGDAVMAVFGIPLLHEDDAVRAVRAAHGMQEALSSLNDELERDHGVRIAIRIGVNTGEIVAGDPTAGQRLVTGDAVNVAARLEQAAGSGEVLIGVSTYWLVKDAVEVEEVTALDLKGKTEPVAAYRLRAVRAGTAGHVRNLDLPMVGRVRELELIKQSLERARDERTSYMFTLLGSAGVGKSRLIGEFLGAIDDARVLRGRCLSYGDGITFYALGEIVREAAEVAEADDSATAAAKLKAVMDGVEDGDRIARLVGGLFGWADPSTAEDASWATRKLFEHLARERPLVVVVDDIHWAEPLMLDLIEHLADWTREAMLLILCVARPELLELRPGWGGGKVNATSILLEPLAAGEADALLDHLLGEAVLPGTARERILAAAEGNPLFVEEMIGMLIDDGLLRYDDGAWRAVSDLADLTVPPTIQLLLAARLDRLEAEERAVIERGAVEGKVFHTGAITSLAPEGLRAQVRPRLLALARKELIRPDRAEFAGEDAFRFRHMLIRDAAYQAMPKEQRAELHEGFARWLTGAAGERVAEYEEILGYHLEQAHRYRTELGPSDERTLELGREAGQALRASAERALSRGDLDGATRLLERSIELLDGVERAATIVELGEILTWKDEEKRAIPLLRDFLASPAAAESPGLRIRAEMYLVFAGTATDPTQTMEGAYSAIEILLAEAEALGDEDAIVAGLLGGGQFASWLGRTHEQRVICERLLPRVADLRTIYRDWVGTGLRMDVFWGSAPVDEGLGMVGTMQRISGDSVLGSLATEATRAALLAMADRVPEFDATLDRYDQVRSDLGLEAHDPGAQPRAESLWLLGRLDEAVAVLREEKAYLDSRGETGVNSTTTAMLAIVLAESGRIDEADSLIAEAVSMAASDDFATHVEIGVATALVSLARGDHAAAMTAIDGALARVRRTDYLNHTADALRVRGQVLLAADRPTEAQGSFDEALAIYERKGNVASARRLREWLGTTRIQL